MSWGFGFADAPNSPPSGPELISGLLAWYDANFGMTTSGSSATAWADQSGHGDSNRNFAGGTAKPTINLADSSYNSKNTLSFLGSSSQYMTTGTWSISPVAVPYTVIMVGEISDTATVQTVIDNIVSAEVTLLHAGAVGAMEIYNGGSLTSVGSLTTNVPAVWAMTFDGTSQKLFKNNHATPVVSGTSGTNGIHGLIIGTDYHLDNVWLTGKLANILVYNRDLSAALSDMLSAFTYLGSRYGISIT